MQYDLDLFLTRCVKSILCLTVTRRKAVKISGSRHWCKFTGNALLLFRYRLTIVGDNDQMHIKISSTWLCRSLLPWGYVQDGDCGRWSVIYSVPYASNCRRRTRLTANGNLASSRPAVTEITRVCLIWHTHTRTHFAQQRARLVCVFVPGWERSWANDRLSVDAKYAKRANMIQNTKDLWHERAAPARVLLACLPTGVITRWHTYLPHTCHQITVLGIRKRVCVRHLSRRGDSLWLGWCLRNWEYISTY